MLPKTTCTSMPLAGSLEASPSGGGGVAGPAVGERAQLVGTSASAESEPERRVPDKRGGIEPNGTLPEQPSRIPRSHAPSPCAS